MFLFGAFGYWVLFAALSPCRLRGPLLHAVPVVGVSVAVVGGWCSL